MSESEAEAVWEERYRAAPQVWSGRVNAQLERIAAQLPPGRALDLGCGEGGDALWLAGRGWEVLGVDVSGTALARAEAESTARGVAGLTRFERHDLTARFPEAPGEGFDLVSAQFLHSTVAMDRAVILRRAAAAVAPGGSLLIVDHAEAPPWATAMHDHEFPTAEQVIAGLELGSGWERVRVEGIERAVTGPDGQPATLVDNVIWLRRAPR
jgi:SAM-dependent methyltransferase